MDKQELRKINGDVYFIAERRADNAYIFVNWTGIQTLDMIMLGAQLLLAMLRKKPCQAILNSNKEVIGPWDEGALFLGNKWAQQAKELGLTHFAHVMAYGIYGKNSFKLFHQYAQHHLQIKKFETEQEAKFWLLDRPAGAGHKI